MRNEEKNCKNCNELFTPTRTDAKYCSASCKQISYKNRLKNDNKHINTYPEPVNLYVNEIGFTDNQNVKLPVKSQELTDNSNVNISNNKIEEARKFKQDNHHQYKNKSEDISSTELIPVNQKKLMVNPTTTPPDMITFNPHRNVIDENLINTDFDLSDYKRYKQYERSMNISCGINMKVYLSEQNINTIEFIRIANHNLSSMINFLFQCSRLKFPQKTKFVNEFLKEIKVYMSSYKFENLPLNYPYYGYFQYIKDKINLYIIHAEMENKKNIHFKLTDKTKVNFEYILIDIID